MQIFKSDVKDNCQFCKRNILEKHFAAFFVYIRNFTRFGTSKIHFSFKRSMYRNFIVSWLGRDHHICDFNLSLFLPASHNLLLQQKIYRFIVDCKFLLFYIIDSSIRRQCFLVSRLRNYNAPKKRKTVRTLILNKVTQQQSRNTKRNEKTAIKCWPWLKIHTF